MKTYNKIIIPTPNHQLIRRTGDVKVKLHTLYTFASGQLHASEAYRREKAG
jgi:hypothetical protein